MPNEIGPTVREQIKEVMDETLPAELKDVSAIATPGEISRRRWFGGAMLILAGVCMAVAAAPWPSRGLFDLTTWSIYSMLLLLVGAWQIDRASRDEIEAERPILDLSWDSHPGTDQNPRIRRVK